MSKTIAIYCGSFKPYHIGHLNITEKAESIFGIGNVIISIGINPAKVENFNRETYINQAEELSKKLNRKVEVYFTFLHEYIEEKEKEYNCNVVLIRGLRNGDDLNYEINQLRFIEDFKPDIKTIFIMCDKKFEHISSSSIKILESFREGSSKQYTI